MAVPICIVEMDGVEGGGVEVAFKGRSNPTEPLSSRRLASLVHRISDQLRVYHLQATGSHHHSLVRGAMLPIMVHGHHNRLRVFVRLEAIMAHHQGKAAATIEATTGIDQVIAMAEEVEMVAMDVGGKKKDNVVQALVRPRLCHIQMK